MSESTSSIEAVSRLIADDHQRERFLDLMGRLRNLPEDDEQLQFMENATTTHKLITLIIAPKSQSFVPITVLSRRDQLATFSKHTVALSASA